MDTLSTMHLFAKVVELGSFTRAAASLALPKSTVSRQISALEQRLGVRLLERTTRSVRPTEAGQAFFRRCSQIVSEVAEAEQEVMQTQVEPSGTLRVTAPVSIGVRTLGQMVGRYLQRFPKVRLELSLSDRRADLVEEGFDVAIRAGALADSSMIARRLRSAPMVVAASPGYLAAHGTPRTPDDLRHHACMLYEYARTSGWRFQVAGREHVVPVSGPFVGNNGDVLRDAAVAGLGITYAPDFIMAPELATGGLVPVLSAYTLQTSAIWAVFPETRLVSTKVRSFVDAMVDEFSAL